MNDEVLAGKHNSVLTDGINDEKNELIKKINEYDREAPKMLRKIYELFNKRKSKKNFAEACVLYAKMLIGHNEINNSITNEINFSSLREQKMLVELWEPISDIMEFYADEIKKKIKSYNLKKVSSYAYHEVLAYIAKSVLENKVPSKNKIHEILKRFERKNPPRVLQKYQKNTASNE